MYIAVRKVLLWSKVSKVLASLALNDCLDAESV